MCVCVDLLDVNFNFRNVCKCGKMTVKRYLCNRSIDATSKRGSSKQNIYLGSGKQNVRCKQKQNIQW